MLPVSISTYYMLGADAGQEPQVSPSAPRPFAPPIIFPNASDVVTIKLDTCGGDTQARKCLSIDTVFYLAFIAFDADVVNSTSDRVAFELSDGLAKFATLAYAPLGGMTISSIAGQYYNETLLYDNAPPTDDMNGTYLIFVGNHVMCADRTNKNLYILDHLLKSNTLPNFNTVYFLSRSTLTLST